MKSINKVLSILGASVLAFSLTVVSVSALTVKDTQKSTASVTFVKGDTEEPVKPIDPDPEVPVDPKPEEPEEGGETGSTGDLTIDYVPVLRFGELKIEGKEQTAKSTSNKAFVQVSDRRSTGQGWKLKGALSSFKLFGEDGKEAVEAEAHEITEAKITFTEGSAVIGDKSSNSAAPTVHDPIELTAGGEAKNIMTASKNEGMGTWVAAWIDNKDGLNNKIELTINSRDAKIGQYIGVIEWTLTQEP